MRNGVTPHFFCGRTAKTKVTGNYYTKHLRTQLIPACEKLYPENNFTFQQDGATSHTCNVCQAYLKDTLGRGRFVSKTEWPHKVARFECSGLLFLGSSGHQSVRIRHY